MNKKIIKVVLVIAIVFCFAAMPISGMIGNPISRMVRADQADGVVRNVAPTNSTAKAASCFPFDIGDTIVYNDGTDTTTFNATIFDANADTGGTGGEINNASCWISIYNATTVNTHNWTFVWDATTTTLQSFGAGTAGDGYFFIASNTSITTPNIVWTVPLNYAIGTITVKFYVVDDNGASLYQTDTCDCQSAISVLGVYNFTGLAVDTTTKYWNFTANPSDPGVAPGTLNVTSGNYTTYAYDEATATPANNQLYNNATARTYSFWLVVQNTSTGTSPITFRLNFVGSSFTGSTDTILINTVMKWEWYEGTAAPGGADDPTDRATDQNYTAVDADGSYDFTFTNTGDYIWIRYMIDIPAVSADETYTCAYTVDVV